MANVKKFTRTSLGHIFKHFDRTDNLAMKKNKNIDPTRTDQNYNLLYTFDPEAKNQSQQERINNRLSEVKCMKRKDVNVMCSWTVTLPKDFDGDPEKFFGMAYLFLSERYCMGNDKNIISAWVHMDETTPHLHFAFVPVVIDKKKGIEKVSAKELITRADLQSFHEDFQKFIDTMLPGINATRCSLLNEATKDGNKTIDQLKAETNYKRKNEYLEELEGLEIKIIDQERIKKNNSEVISKQVERYNNLEQEVDDLTKKIEEKKKDLNTVSNELNQIRSMLERQKSELLEQIEKKKQVQAELKQLTGGEVVQKILELYEDCKTAQRLNYNRDSGVSFDTLDEACDISFNREGERFIDYDMDQLADAIGVTQAWDIGDVVFEQAETAVRKEKGLVR